MSSSRQPVEQEPDGEAAEREHERASVASAVTQRMSDERLTDTHEAYQRWMKRAESAEQERDKAIRERDEAEGDKYNATRDAEDARAELASAWEAAHRSGFPVPATLDALIDYMVRSDASTRANVLELEKHVERLRLENGVLKDDNALLYETEDANNAWRRSLEDRSRAEVEQARQEGYARGNSDGWNAGFSAATGDDR